MINLSFHVRLRLAPIAWLIIFFIVFVPADLAFAASGLRSAPPGAFSGAPSEYTRFTPRELSRGFLALAFGSDLRLGSKLRRIHRFDRPVHVHFFTNGSVDRTNAYRRIVLEFAREFPALQLTIIDDAASADIVVRLIDEKNFNTAITAVFGRQTARAFVAKTDAQCMTSVRSAASGGIIRADSFVIIDQGDDVFLNCAYHEMLHALGLPNHDSGNPWTALNQDRTVGYLTVYDRAMLRMLYDPRVRSGMTSKDVMKVVTGVARDVSGRL